MTHIVDAWHWIQHTRGSKVVNVGHAASLKEAKAIAGRYLYQETPFSVTIRRMSDGEVVCSCELVKSRLKWFYPEEKKC